MFKKLFDRIKRIYVLLFDVTTSATALIILAVSIGVISWPMANHLVSYFWWSVGALVGVWEIGLKVFTGKTLTTHVRQSRRSQPISYWLMNFVWLYFGVTLFLHFIKPVILGGS